MKKKPVYIFYILFISAWSQNFLYAQHLNKKNPTYFTSNMREIQDLIKWENGPYEQISFCRDSSLRSNGYMLAIKNSVYPLLNNNRFNPFILDTNFFDRSGYCYFYPNTSWFERLMTIDVTRKNKSTSFGKLVEPSKMKKQQVKELFKMLIQFGVVDTYDHLYAELVITKEKEDTEKIQIYYHCMYHLCTSTCVDPEYNFSLRFFKKTGELMAETN